MKGCRNNAGGSGVIAAFFGELENAARSSNFSFSRTVPIGAIGPITFTATYGISGAAVKCCDESSGEIAMMFSGSFYFAIEGGVGAIAGGPPVGGSTGFSGGELPTCETTIGSISYTVSVSAKFGIGFGLGAGYSLAIAECDGNASCSWTFNPGDGDVEFGGEGVGGRIALEAKASVSGTYYDGSN